MKMRYGKLAIGVGGALFALLALGADTGNACDQVPGAPSFDGFVCNLELVDPPDSSSRGWGEEGAIGLQLFSLPCATAGSVALNSPIICSAGSSACPTDSAKYEEDGLMAVFNALHLAEKNQDKISIIDDSTGGFLCRVLFRAP